MTAEWPHRSGQAACTQRAFIRNSGRPMAASSPMSLKFLAWLKSGRCRTHHCAVTWAMPVKGGLIMEVSNFFSGILLVLQLLSGSARHVDGTCDLVHV
jgi:hypothetical protein